jgi:hypothetical protein
MVVFSIVSSPVFFIKVITFSDRLKMRELTLWTNTAYLSKNYGYWDNITLSGTYYSLSYRL